MKPHDSTVLLLTTGSNLGGAETSLARLVPRLRAPLAEGGLTVQVLHLLDGGPAPFYLASRGVSSGTLGLSTGCEPVALPRLLAYLRRHRVRLIHAFGLRANLLARLAAPLAGARVVTAVLSTDPGRSGWQVTADRLTRAGVSGWIANAEACRRTVIDRERARPDKVRVIRDGIELDRYPAPRERVAALRDRLGLSEEIPVLAVPANLRPAKGHEDLVRAVAALPDRVQVVCAGQDFLGGRIRSLAAEEGVSSRFIFPGFVEDVAALLTLADLVVLPSHWEGLPIALVEAMACGTPVLATDVGGVSELVHNGWTGLLVPPRRPDLLAGRIRTLLEDASFRERLAERAHAQVVHRHDADRSAALHAETYLELTGAAA